ncbi:MAG: sulfite exporter TauE/SafE family protein [Aeoliella sp.]
MTELSLIFIGGLLGSSHCLGMCGPLALTLGMAEVGIAANMRRQLVYSAGRIFTYGFLGAGAGFCGWWLSHQPMAMVNAQSLLAIGAGIFLVIIGLASTGVLPDMRVFSLLPKGCGAAGWLKTYLTAPGLTGALLAGVFTGFLPCGLVYAFLTLAAASANLFHGWLTMTLFGLGTVPLMVLTGCGGSLLSHGMRSRVLQVAAWCVVVAGLITLTRGIGFMQLSADTVPPGCPLCP